MSSIALKLPNSYVEIERDEMEYVDGGWSGSVLKANLEGIGRMKFGGSKALRFAGGLAAGIPANITYWGAVSGFGPQIGALMGSLCELGPVSLGAGAIAALGAAGAVTYLGNHRKFY